MTNSMFCMRWSNKSTSEHKTSHEKVNVSRSGGMVVGRLLDNSGALTLVFAVN